jgi:hypothetical protein
MDAGERDSTAAEAEVQEETVEVHAPHHPIVSWKEFGIHLVAITVGLLIAVGIEGLVERHREHVLVREARETMRAEIEHNSEKMQDAVPEIEAERATMEANIKALTRILENPKDKGAQKASVSADFSIVGLRDTAWKTAQATNALAFMPYEEAQRYADVYGSQQAFGKAQDAIQEDESQLMGVFAETDFGHNDVTPEQAGMALERFGIWRGHLLFLALTAKVTAANDTAFLEGKEAPTSMSEKLSKQ